MQKDLFLCWQWQIKKSPLASKNTQQSTYHPCLFVPGLLNPLFFYFQPFNCQCLCTIFITSKPAKSSITGAIFQAERNFFAIKLRGNISRMSSHNRRRRRSGEGWWCQAINVFWLLHCVEILTLWCQIHRRAIKRYVSLRKMFLWWEVSVFDNGDPP